MIISAHFPEAHCTSDNVGDCGEKELPSHWAERFILSSTWDWDFRYGPIVPRSSPSSGALARAPAALTWLLATLFFYGHA